MARAADTGLRKEEALLDLAVDRELAAAARLGLQVAIEAVVLRVLLQDPCELPAAARADDGGVDVARLELEAAADLPVVAVDPVADDAGHPFQGSGSAMLVGREHRLSQLHANRRVAADAEVAVGTVGQLRHRGLHGVEDGADLRVGVG